MQIHSTSQVGKRRIAPRKHYINEKLDKKFYKELDKIFFREEPNEIFFREEPDDIVFKREPDEIVFVGGMTPGMPKACQTGWFEPSRYRFKGCTG